MPDINLNIDFNAIFSLITSPKIQAILFPAKIALLALSAGFVGFIVFALLRTHYLQWLFIQDVVQFFTMRPFGAKKITKQWSKITDYLERGNESEYKLAVIEVDDMLDTSLKRLGYGGQTLEEKLEKLTSATITNIKQLHEVHRLRNNIIHDPDYRLTLEETKKTLDVYNQAFRDLQILGE